MKGFSFEQQERAFAQLSAGDADAVYGDSFTRSGRAVNGIGNNVSLTFDEMNFGKVRNCSLIIKGRTNLNVNSITVRIRDSEGNTFNEVADFRGSGSGEQCFPVSVPGGRCSVTFVFLPGSNFDFESFRFVPE